MCYTFGNMLGNKYNIQRIENLLKKGELPHALLFSGPKYIGKTNYAKDLAERILGDYSKIDYLEIKPRIPPKKTREIISVDDIRDLKKNLAGRAQGGKRVIILREVEKMRNSAQNAFLKVLEEPAEGITFIMIANNIEGILSTIKSRVVHFSFVRPKFCDWSDELKEGIEELDSDEKLILEGIPELWRKMKSEECDIIKEQLAKSISIVKGKTYERLPSADLLARKSEREELQEIIDLSLIYAYKSGRSEEILKKILEVRRLLNGQSNKRLLLAQIALTK